MKGSRLRWTVGLVLGITTLNWSHAAEVNVFAAASLTDVLKEIATAWEKSSGDKVAYQFGASSTLARQIDEGAPADLFISADEARMDGLEGKGRILKNSRRSLLSNTLVIIVAGDSALRFNGPSALVSVKINKIALADTRIVPAGIYAKAYLMKVGLWDKIAGKVVPTENVHGALAAVEVGNAEAAIVYKTDAIISKNVKVAYEVPVTDCPKISYSFAVVAESKQAEAARKFLSHLGSDTAAAVFKKHGFLVLK